MNTLRKLLSSSVFAFALSATSAFGDELLHFDNPSIVIATRPDGKISGYYIGRSNEPYLFEAGSLAICKFLIFGESNGDGSYRIKAWETSLVPAPESRISRGAAFTENGNWTIQFDEVPNGCHSKKDGDAFLWFESNYFSERSIPIKYRQDQGLHAKVVQRTVSIGVRIVHVDSAPVYETPTNASSAKPVFSMPLGSIALSLEQKGEYSKVEYIAPASGEKKSGWVRTRQLKDPFKY